MPKKSSRRTRYDREEREARIAEMIARAKKSIDAHHQLIQELERHLESSKQRPSRKLR